MIKSLKNIGSVKMGHSFRSRLEQVPDGKVQVIQMKDLTDDNRLDDRNLALIEMQKLQEHHQVKLNDLVFRSRGMTNTVALIDREVECTIVSAPLLRIRVNDTSILPEYLCWFINLPASQAFLQTRATGTAMRMIGKQALDALDVQVPSLETQRRIIQVIRLASEERRLQARLAEKRKQLVERALMQAASDPGSQ